MGFFTLADAIAHGLDYLGPGSASDSVQRDLRRAALEAYRDIANAHNWSYLYRHGRIITQAPYGTSVDNSTLQYQATAGTYPLEVTLTGGTWPAWAAAGYIKVGLLKYRVAARISATILTLDSEVIPSADLAAGTNYTLYQDTYLLPADFMSQDQALYEQNFGGMVYVHPREWLYENRYVFAEGVPQAYTVTGDPQYPNRLVIRIAPLPTFQATIDFIYKRQPRPMVIPALSTGNCSITGSTNLITCSASVFTPAMVGSVIRIGGAINATALPTNLVGLNPALFESVITGIVSATQANTTDNALTTLTSVPYVISDPVDIQNQAMLNCYMRCMEKHIGMSRTLKDKPSAAQQYMVALNEARSADSRSFTNRFAGPQNKIRQRFRDMPVGPDQS